MFVFFYLCSNASLCYGLVLDLLLWHLMLILTFFRDLVSRLLEVKKNPCAWVLKINSLLMVPCFINFHFSEKDIFFFCK